jgi:hypothetical protein
MKCERCMKDESQLTFLFTDTLKEGSPCTDRVTQAAMFLCGGCVMELVEELKAFRTRFLLQLKKGGEKKERSQREKSIFPSLGGR